MVKFPKGVTFTEKLKKGYDRVLTPEAVGFVARLHRSFEERRRALIKARAERQKLFDKGALPDFLPETRALRDGRWTVAPIPADLQDRRVEITGPTDRKMVINALNSGAKVFMTDFEDSNSPTWDNMIQGQVNLMDRWAGSLDYTDPQSGKSYRLGRKPAVLLVRPRGWHLLEEHMQVDGASVAGALSDFGLYVFHNAKPALAGKSGPYFYLPKMESHREARLWNDVFIHAQSE
jgi:malate synthase